MKVCITEDHIKRGFPGVPDSCPIALALREDHGWEDVEIVSASAWIGKERIMLPDAARSFIADFDWGDGVEPFEFEIEARP